MSSSVSRLASFRVLNIMLVTLIGFLGQSLVGQESPAIHPSAAHAPALKISGKISPSEQASVKPDAAAMKKAALEYLHLPLSFEKNQGQTDARVKFLSRGAGYGLFLTNNEAVLSFGGQKTSAITMRFLGANATAAISGTDRLSGTSNYFIGNDRSKWHTNVPNFGKVEYQSLYSGINLIYYGNQQKLEHDFVIAPHADASKIRFAIEGAKKLALEKSGDLVVTTAAGELRLRKPAIFQTIGGQRKEIAGGYALKQNQISFNLGAYDHSRELTIDPVLILSTYLTNSSGVSAIGVAADTSGIYVTGNTQAALGTLTLDQHGDQTSANDDVYVVKLAPAGNQLIYSAIIGGTGPDHANAIAVDGSGNASVGGFTQSNDFPTASAGTPLSATLSGSQDGFFLQLNSSGTALSYSSYFGGTGNSDAVNGIAVNGGQIYLTGKTDSANGISTPNSFQPALEGTTLNAFVAAINPAGNSTNDLTYGTYLGGTASDSGNGIAVSGTNGVFVTGNATSADFPVSNGSTLGGSQDAFVAKFETTSASITTGAAACDGAGLVTVTNTTNSFTNGEVVTISGLTSTTGNFNATGVQLSNVTSGANGSFQYSVTDCGAAANANDLGGGTATGGRVYATYLGATGDETGNAIAVDASSNAYITGSTTSPTVDGLATAGAFQTTLGDASGDAYMAKLSPTGATSYFTYLGGTAADQGNAIAVDGAGIAFIGGQSSSNDLVTTNGLITTAPAGQNGFVAKLNPAGTGATDLIYQTYLGGSGTDSVSSITLNSGVAVVAGNTSSSDLTTTASAFQPALVGTNAAFVASLDAADANGSTLAFNGTTTTVAPDPIRSDTNQRDPITYTYEVNNTGTASASNVVFNDPIPGGATPKISIGTPSATDNTGTPISNACTKGTGGVTCQLGTIVNGEKATVTIPATPTAAADFPNATITNTGATVASAETTSVSAPDLTSNIVRSSQIVVTALQTAPNLGTPVANGGTVTLQITATNNGPNDIPATQSKISFGSSGSVNATFTVTNVVPGNGADMCDGSFVCTLDLLQQGGGNAHTFTVTGTVALTGGFHTGSIAVTATLVPNPANAFQFDDGSQQTGTTGVINIATLADLATVISPVSQTVNGGTANSTFTIKITNNATFTSGGVTMNGNTAPSAQLSGTITLTNSSFGTVTVTPGDPGDDCGGAGAGNPFTLAGNTFTCSLANVAPGALAAHTFILSGTPTITGTNAAGSVKLDASIAPVGGTYLDPLSANDAAPQATLTITPVADLATVVAPATQTVNNGTANTTLTVTVSNVAGNSVANTQLAGTLVLTNSSFGTVTVQPGNAGDDCGAGAGTPFTLAGNTFTCAVSQLDQGTPHTFTVKGTPTITGTNISGSVRLDAALTAVSTYSESNPGDENSSGTVTITPVADLSSSTIGAASVNSGSPASFTMQVSDGGPNSAPGTTLSGKITISNASFAPILTPQVGDSCSPVTFGGGNPNVGTFTCTLGQIDVSSPHSIGVSGTPVITGTFTTGSVKVEVLTLAGSYFDPNNAGQGVNNDPSNFTTTLIPVADLTSSATGAASVNSGSPASFTVQVSDGGPNSVAGTTLSGQITVTNANFTPTLAPQVGDSCSSVTFGGGNPNIGTFTCTLGQIDNGSPHSITISGIPTIPGTFTSGSVRVDVLGLSGSYFDPNTGNDASNFTTNLIPVAHLSTSLTRTTAAILQEGDPISYTLQVSNSGPNYLASGTAKVTGTFAGSGAPTAPNSVINGLALSGCASFTVNTPNPGDYVCILPATNVASPAVTISITGTAHVTSGIIDVLNGTSTAAPNSGGYFESSPGTTSTTAPTTSIQPKTHLSTSISRTTSAVVREGDAISYTIHIASSAMDLAANASVISGTFAGSGSPVAPNSTISSMALTNCVSFTVNTPNPGNYTCVLPTVSVASGANIIVSGTAHVITGIQDTLTGNTAAAPNGNNYFETSLGTTNFTAPNTVIQPVTDLQPSIPVAPSTLQNGQTTSYVVRVTNNGLGTANNLAAGAAKVTGGFTGANSSFAINAAALPAGCTAVTSSTYSCVLSALNFGQNQQFTIVGTATLNSGSASDTLTVSATVSPNNANDYFDNTPGNDNATANTLIKGVANLTLTFSGSASAVLVGNNLVYSIDVANANGFSDAAGVNVRVPLGTAGQVFVPAGAGSPSSSANCSILPADAAANIITCVMGAAGTVPANSSAPATVVILASALLVPTSAPGSPRQATYLQSATVNVDATQTVNSNAANKTQNVNSTFTAAAHITVQTSVSANPSNINPDGVTYNDEIYTTTVTNVPGRSDAKNVMIVDTPPGGANVTFVSKNIVGGGASSCSGPDSFGKVTCNLPLLASGTTATITVRVTPKRIATTAPMSITDAIALTSSDVADPGPAGGMSDGSTIPVNNTTTGQMLPLTAGSSGRNVVLQFGTITSPGVTSFDTASNFGGLALNPKYPLGAQPPTALLYNFTTTAVTSTLAQFCFDASLQTFAKPERVRMFMLSAGAPVDITTSISPIPTAPTVGKLLSTICGSAPFSNTFVSLGIFEPANNAPSLNTSSVMQTGNPDRQITGQIMLDATPTVDPDDNQCNGNATFCHDQTQLTYLWTTSNPGGFTDVNGGLTVPSFSTPNPSGVFLPLGKNQTVTLTVKDPLGVAGVLAGGIATKTFAIDVINTPIGGAVNVNPVDGRILTRGTPVSITFGNVNSAGVTTLDSSAGTFPPVNFRFGQNGLRYTIATDAIVSGSTQVCVDTSQQRFVKPERVRLLELSPTFGDITTSISPVPTIPSKGQIVNTVCGVLSGYTTGTMQLAVLEPVNNKPVIGLTFTLSNSQDAGKGVTGNFVDLNPVTSVDSDTNACNGNNTQCSDTPQLRFFFFGPFPGALQSTSVNPIVRNVSLPGGTTTITVAAVDQTVTIPANVTISTPADLQNLTDGIAQNGLTITQFPVTIDSTTPGGGSTGNTATIRAGQSASFIFTPITPTGGPVQGSGTLTLTCSNGSTTPSLSSLQINCNITPPTFTIGSSSAPALLISTAGATFAMVNPPARPGSPMYGVWAAFLGMPVAGVVFIGLAGIRRKRTKVLIVLGLLALAIGSQVACGGGGGANGAPKFQSAGTPLGTYEIVVTGTQNGSTVSKNSFTITVQ